MAADEALLETAAQPVLRLYSWEGPCLSLGWAQRRGWLDEETCRRAGVEVVRRPTGGRALLHLPGEITYALVLPDTEGVSVAAAFAGITASLARALRSLGVPVRVAGATAGPLTASCLSRVQAGELVLGERKLVGSAQVRRGGRLLQHGALPRRVDADLWQSLLPGPCPADLASCGRADLRPEDLAAAWLAALGPSGGL